MSDLRFLGHDLIFVSTKPAAAQKTLSVLEPNDFATPSKREGKPHRCTITKCVYVRADGIYFKPRMAEENNAF